MRLLIVCLATIFALPAMGDTISPISPESLALARAFAFRGVSQELEAFSNASIAVTGGTFVNKDDGTVVYEIEGRAGTIDVNCGPTSLTITGKERPLPFGPGKMITYSAVFDGSQVRHGGGCL